MAALCMLLVSCGDSTQSSQATKDPTISPSQSATDAVCAAAARVRELDDEIQGELNDEMRKVLSMADSAKVRRNFEEFIDRTLATVERRLEPVRAAYAELEATVPDHLADDVAFMGEVGFEVLERMDRVTRPEDFEKVVVGGNPRELIAAGEAALKVDRFTRKRCNIVIAN
jgi:hypothetical protein